MNDNLDITVTTKNGLPVCKSFTDKVNEFVWENENKGENPEKQDKE